MSDAVLTISGFDITAFKLGRLQQRVSALPVMQRLMAQRLQAARPKPHVHVQPAGFTLPLTGQSLALAGNLMRALLDERIQPYSAFDYHATPYLITAADLRNDGMCFSICRKHNTYIKATFALGSPYESLVCNATLQGQLNHTDAVGLLSAAGSAFSRAIAREVQAASNNQTRDIRIVMDALEDASGVMRPYVIEHVSGLYMVKVEALRCGEFTSPVLTIRMVGTANRLMASLYRGNGVYLIDNQSPQHSKEISTSDVGTLLALAAVRAMVRE